MTPGQMYDRFAHPHLPKTDPYAGRIRSAFCANAEEMVVWVVDAQSAMLRQGGGRVPAPIGMLADHVLSASADFPGSGLTSTMPCDRLGTLVDQGDRTLFGRMMVDLAVLHLVRAADAVSVGIANADLEPGNRIDVTSPARGALVRQLAAIAACQVMERLADEMPRLDDMAFLAAAAWTRRTLH